MILALLLSLAGIHFLIALILLTGIARRYPRRTDTPFISVVVPVRNEEANLPRLLESLLKLDYPTDRHEIILVNDESEDRTREIADSFAPRFACDYRVIEADHSREDVLRAKTLPLAQGLDVARGEFVLMTDGDCEIPPIWARAMVSYFTGDVAVVCGVTLPDLSRPPGFPTTWLEAVDWSYLLGVCAGFAGRGFPLALIGNNYAVSMAAYRDMGTFRRMEFPSIDDIALQRAVMKSGRWKLIFPVDANSLMCTLPIGSVFEQARQRRRWAKGKEIMDWKGQAILMFAAFTHLTWPLWMIPLGVAGLLPALLIAVGDWIVIGSTLARVRKRKPLLTAILYPLHTFFYGWLWIFYLLRSRTVEWKARPFSG